MTQHEQVFVFKGQLSLEGATLRHAVQRLIRLAQQGSRPAEIWATVREIVPECAIHLGEERVARMPERRPAGDQCLPMASTS